MALLEYIILYGSIFAFIITMYLLAIMKGLNPRIWAFSDYPKEITEIVEPQTQREKRIAGYIALPFFFITFGYPIIVTLFLESSQGGTISFLDAFLVLFGLMLFGTFGDFIILDLIIVGTLRPTWVMIPGTEHLRDTAYKDFRKYHAIGHAKSVVVMIFLSLILSALIVYL